MHENAEYFISVVTYFREIQYYAVALQSVGSHSVFLRRLGDVGRGRRAAGRPSSQKSMPDVCPFSLSLSLSLSLFAKTPLQLDLLSPSPFLSPASPFRHEGRRRSHPVWLFEWAGGSVPPIYRISSYRLITIFGKTGL